MERTITITQAAEAMKLDVQTLQRLLGECGICPQNGALTMEQVERLLGALESRRQDSSRRAQEKLDRLVGRYTIMVDTCSLLHEQFPLLLEHMAPLLRQYGRTIIIPSSVKSELERLAATRPELTQRIVVLSRLLKGQYDQGLLRFVGSPQESFGDQQLLAAAMRYLTDTSLMVITQDKALSADLLGLNNLGAVKGRRLEVYLINQYGYLTRYLTPEQRQSRDSVSRNSAELFPAAALKAEQNQLLTVTRSSGEGDLVRTSQGVVRLGRELASGGEGAIYDLGDGTVAKIYRQDKLTVGRRDKLSLMVSQQPGIPGVCWPKELLYDVSGGFVGYRMDKARGVELQRGVFSQQAVQRYFPTWKKLDMVRLSISILEKISALHRCGILLGDINPRNILAVSPEEVWIVDCDSCQVGGYPCPVGTIRFTAPEIQGRNFSTFLRTIGNEDFAVATLLFMLMLPGKSPYAQQGGEDLGETIRKMNFPYCLGENRGNGTPEGGWKYMWSHLPRYLKEDFYQTFQAGGKYSTEQTRLSAEAWLQAFRSYEGLLAKGILQAKDPESGELFPTRRKAVNMGDLATYQTRTCLQCGSTFAVTVGENRYLETHQLSLPRRCPTCRKVRKLVETGLLSYPA